MRILWIDDVFWPHIRGGAENRSYNLVQALARTGHDVEVLTLRTIPVGPEHENLSGTPIVRVESPQLPGCLWRIKPWLKMRQWHDVLRRFFRTRSYDGVISSSTGIAHYTRRVKPRLASVVTTGGTWRGAKRYTFDRPQGGISLRAGGEFAFWQFYVYEKLTYQAADFVVAESKNVREQLVSLYHVNSRKIAVCHNGIDHERFRPRNKERSGFRLREKWPASAFVVISVGRVDRVKNYQYLIQAVSQTPRDANIIAVIVGQGPEQENLEALCRELNVDDRVRFTGYRRDVHELLAAADAFVLPSTFEAYGNVWAEALACGLPSMGLRRVPGKYYTAADEHIQHGQTGFLLAPEDPGDLAQRLVELAASPRARKQMGRAGREWALRTYTWDKTARQYAGLLHRCTAS